MTLKAGQYSTAFVFTVSVFAEGSFTFSFRDSTATVSRIFFTEYFAREYS